MHVRPRIATLRSVGGTCSGAPQTSSDRLATESSTVSMRFMTWNICQGTAKKTSILFAERIDVAVLCEASLDPPQVTLLENPPLLWASTGDIRHKGLAIAGLTIGGQHEPLRVGQGRYALAATLNSGIGVLGIWTCPNQSSKYAPELAKTIESYADFLTSRPCIIAGDFNLDPAGQEVVALQSAFERLAQLGYQSAYHRYFGCEIGDEAHPTHFFQRKRDSRFHIDYVFANEPIIGSLRNVEIGDYETYVERTAVGAGLSDHVPLIVEFDLPRAPLKL
jgi:hypothetical protein